MTLTFAILHLVVLWVVPPALAVILTRRLRVSWRYVGLGSVTYLAALPFLLGVPWAATIVFGTTPLVWSIALAVTAGIAEETARYLVYRRSAALRNGRNWNIAVVVGAAHGGAESMALGMQALLSLVVVFFMPDRLPPAFRVVPSAWFYLLGAILRVLIILVHIGFAVLVWRAVTHQRYGLYIAAVLIHIVADLILFCQPLLLPGYDWISWLTMLALVSAAWQIIRETRPAALSKSNTRHDPLVRTA